VCKNTVFSQYDQEISAFFAYQPVPLSHFFDVAVLLNWHVIRCLAEKRLQHPLLQFS
jgi:hypothetical protein